MGDYYGQEGEGYWFGAGVKDDFNLSGEFNAKGNQSFIDLLEGKMPNGQTLSRKINGKKNIAQE